MRFEFAESRSRENVNVQKHLVWWETLRHVGSQCEMSTWRITEFNLWDCVFVPEALVRVRVQRAQVGFHGSSSLKHTSYKNHLLFQPRPISDIFSFICFIVITLDTSTPANTLTLFSQN